MNYQLGCVDMERLTWELGSVDSQNLAKVEVKHGKIVECDLAKVWQKWR